MSNLVFLFPGQGSQYPGMGRDLLQAHPQGKTIFECAGDILGMDLQDICFHGTKQLLAQTNISQPAIFTVSLLALSALEHHQISCTATGGHSLGEYASMVCAGMVSMEDGYRLIKHRAAAMQSCAQQQGGGMCAVMGQTAAQVEALCDEMEGYVVPVNYNAPLQTVVAGEESAIAQMTATLAQRHIKCVRLGVNAAFHSRLMQPAADEFLSNMQDISFSEPHIRYYSNLTGGLLASTAMPDYLAQHLVSPVRFTDQIQAMHADGYDTFLEVGPGKVLTGLLRKTVKGASAHPIEDEKSLTKLLENLKD